MTTVAGLGEANHKVQWCPACVIPTTLIQTNPSTKEIKDVQEGNLVLGIDGDYHKVTKTMSHIHKGPIYKIKVKCFGDTTLTPEHPMFAVRRDKKDFNNKTFKPYWTDAGLLNEGDYLAYPIPKKVEDLEYLELKWDLKETDTRSKPLPNKIPIGEDFLKLAGYFIAEGSIHKREIILTFSSKEMHLVNEAKATFKKLFNLESTIIERKNNSVDIRICSTPLILKFLEWFETGAAKKQIPRFLMLLPPEKQKSLIKGLWLGDGWVGKPRASYKTISLKLCEQVKLLLLRQGIVPNITINKAYKNHKTAYSVFVTGSKDFNKLAEIVGKEKMEEKKGKPPIQRDSNYAYLPIRKIETFDYEGEVYNLEVEGVESYVTSASLVHNCGDFPILLSIKTAISELGLDPKDVVVVSGIGCSGKLPHYVKTYGFEGLHGRALPPANAIKLANRNLIVIVVGGDGDGYGIGMGHFIHSMRRNLDIVYLVHNNQVYGLTTGQASPTTFKGTESKSTPFGVIEPPVNPLTTALSSHCTFIARGFAGDVKHLTELIKEGIKHKGFAFIDCMQPCVTYNKINTYKYFQDRCYKLSKDNHDPSNFQAAQEKATQWEREDKIPIGIVYQTQRQTYEDELPQIAEKPLVKQDISNVDIEPLMDEFS